MSNTSRSGLVPAKRRKYKLIQKPENSNDCLPSKFEALPMALSLRPFGGIYNPFAKGCSVLCNHPAPTAVKDMINQFKTTLTIEGKNLHHTQQRDEKSNEIPARNHETDNIPEDLFRRYTDTDSRPMTPSPTVTSIRTRTSASFLNIRRCITPEFGKTDENIKRKKIILDLRRSHSQETLYWKPSSDISQSLTDIGDQKSKSAGANEDKKTKRQKSEEQRPKSSNDATVAAAVGSGAAVELKDDLKLLPQTCINERNLNDDDDDLRRGRKRKKIKSGQQATTTTTKIFHLSQDPETQVATLPPDSLNPSTRPSLIPNSMSLLPSKEKRESQPVLLKGSFLTDDAFQALKIDLDIDVIENTFDRYLNRALREAIKFIPPKPKSARKSLPEIPEKLSFVLQSKMPRKFSKSATRFDVPMNLNAMQTMTVLDYLSKFVWVSRQRKYLYKRVFLKYINEDAEEVEEGKEADAIEPTNDDGADNNHADEQISLPCSEYVERVMSMEKLPEALEDALEFYGTEENIAEILRLLDFEKLKESTDLDFRTWCGIVSFAERLALADPTCTDSCDELEKADFSSLEERLDCYAVSENLRCVFDIIRRTHNVRY